ncbi:MAG: hypothetical protein ACE5J3_09550 [Methanosarcinales archaeon]
MKEETKQIIKKIISKCKYPPEVAYNMGVEKYNLIKNELEKNFYGKFVVLDVESGDYIVGDDAMAITLEIKRKHPDSMFHLERIGYKAPFKLRGSVK